TVRRFELLAVDERNCILVMMTSDSKVKSQLLRMQLKVDPADLPAAANLLNSHFTNTDPGGMSRHLMSVADQVSPQLFLLLSQAVGFAADALEEAGRREIVTAGASRLLKLPEFRDADKAHELMSFLADSKEELPQPLHREMEILIGPENVKEVLRDTSVVVASYDIGDDMRGLIGVVGPTRMDYAAVAARLSGFAEGLTRLFGKQEELPPKEEPK
ncbi:HrcA family transcriptional regulator, partial [uncultured Oscillibacter sp.]